MSSYLPPVKNLTAFNATVFQDQLTDEEIDTEIKILKLNKLDTYIPNQFIEANKIDPSTSTGTVTFENVFTDPPIVNTQAISSSTNTVMNVNIHSVSTTGFSYSITKYQSGNANPGGLVTSFYYQALGTI
jgi:hypothetical protein